MNNTIFDNQLASIKRRIKELQSDNTKNPIKVIQNKKELKKLQNEIERIKRKKNQEYSIIGVASGIAVLAIIITVMSINEKRDNAARSSSEVKTFARGAEATADEIDGRSSDYSVERFELSDSNDYTTMHSREDRVFSVFAYPAGITADNFSIDSNWEEYISISDVNVEEVTDKSAISFKVTVDPSILSNSSDITAMFTLVSDDGNIRSEDILVPLVGVEISDADSLTLKVDEPQTATFKVVPASLPIEELQIGVNSNVDNMTAKIVDGEKDNENNCQYVHVEITVSGKHNGMSTGYVNLNDIYQIRGGTCEFTIVD